LIFIFSQNWSFQDAYIQFIIEAMHLQLKRGMKILIPLKYLIGIGKDGVVWYKNSSIMVEGEYL